MRLHALGATALLLTAFGVSPADASSGKSVLDGGVTWTATSGDTGAKSRIIGSSTDVRAAYSIKWWEDTDDPCKFEVYNRHLNLGGVKTPETSWCGGSPGNMKWAERRGGDEYITALQVCLTDKNDSTKNKIKGIRVWGRDLDTGVLGAQNGPDESTHTNCKKWKNKVTCPSGQIATKIKVHYNEYQFTSHGFATGISLGCRDVDPK